MSMDLLVFLLGLFLVSGVTGNDNEEISFQSVPQCLKGALELSNFTISTGSGAKPTYSTTVYICYRPDSSTGKAKSILVEYKLTDNNSSSQYYNCNDPLYEEDAVEMFIVPYYNNSTSKDESNDDESYYGGDSYPEKYIEIELNPNSCDGALFVSEITNTCDDCSCISGNELDCTSDGIVSYNSSVSNDKSSWEADIEIDIDFIVDNTGNSGNTSYFRANFFRIDILSTGEEYIAWNPTGKNPPCFHVPSAFGYFMFE